jgi:hypothetical protein
MYLYAAILIAGLLAGGTSAWQVQSWRHGAEQNAQAMADRAREETRQAAQQGAAEAIAALKPVNTTIVQKVQREIQTNTVYRDCRLPADGLRLANESITGRAEPTGAGVVPGAGAPR